MENLEKESFSKLECMECEIGDITEMLWYIYEDFYTLVNEDIYTKANYYDRLGTYLLNIHSLLLSKQKEINEFIEAVYKERKARNNENSKEIENKSLKTTIFYNEEKKEFQRIPVYNSIKMVDGKIIYS